MLRGLIYCNHIFTPTSFAVAADTYLTSHHLSLRNISLSCQRNRIYNDYPRVSFEPRSGKVHQDCGGTGSEEIVLSQWIILSFADKSLLIISTTIVPRKASFVLSLLNSLHPKTHA